MARATFGKAKPNAPFKNNGGTIVFCEHVNDIVSQPFGRELLSSKNGSSFEGKNTRSTLITKDAIINYIDGKYLDPQPYVEIDVFISNHGGFSSAFSRDFGA